jgi:general stress protein CsbA
VAAAMLLFVLTAQVPPVLLVALVICIYLTVWDLRDEDMEFTHKAWWVLLVVLTHVIGYLVFRLWLAHRRGASAQP